MADCNIVILGKWFRMRYHRIQEHRNNKSEIMGFRNKNGEGLIYLEVNCVKWEKNFSEFQAPDRAKDM